MTGLIEEYGVAKVSSGMVNQLMTYWQRQGVDGVGDNLSHAMARVAALQLYLYSGEDYDGAAEIYRRTVEEPDGASPFLGTLKQAGLATPMEEAAYEGLRKLLEAPQDFDPVDDSPLHS